MPTIRNKTRLSILEFLLNSKVKVRCNCGTTKIIQKSHLTSGSIKSCGCLRRERAGHIGKTNHVVVHGNSFVGRVTSEYKTFCAMKQRCYDLKKDNYSFYGGRGIKVLYKSFQEFLDDVGKKPDLSFSIDRKDNNGHYKPGNCRWVTQKSQYQNRR